VTKIILSSEQWDQLFFALPDNLEGVFRTDTQGASFWRQFMTFGPVATFVLPGIDHLPELSDFLSEHGHALCTGYLSYDLGLAIQGVPSRHHPNGPLAIFQAYENWLEYDQGSVSMTAKNPEFIKAMESRIQELVRYQSPKTSLEFDATVNQDDYRRTIDKIHDYIRAGDFYQLNYTQQLDTATSISPRALFAGMIQKHPAAYAGYFEHEQLAILSLSHRFKL